MKFLQLEYFETVCMYKSINKASEKLHVSQPAITKSIQQLELEFDIALFHIHNPFKSLCFRLYSYSNKHTLNGKFFLFPCTIL